MTKLPKSKTRSVGVSNHSIQHVSVHESQEMVSERHILTQLSLKPSSREQVWPQQWTRSNATLFWDKTTWLHIARRRTSISPLTPYASKSLWSTSTWSFNWHVRCSGIRQQHARHPAARHSPRSEGCRREAHKEDRVYCNTCSSLVRPHSLSPLSTEKTTADTLTTQDSLGPRSAATVSSRNQWHPLASLRTSKKWSCHLKTSPRLRPLARNKEDITFLSLLVSSSTLLWNVGCTCSDCCLQTNLVGMSTFSEKRLRKLLCTKSFCLSKEHRLEVKLSDATAHVDHLAVECLACQSLRNSKKD